MPKLMKTRSKSVGLLPGELIHIGEKKRETVQITVIAYNETSFEEKEVKTVEECLAFRSKPGIIWINVEGIHEIDVIRKIGDACGIHPLLQEDILNTDQRPKIEDFGSYIGIILKMLHYVLDKKNGLQVEQVSLILHSNIVISFQEGLKGDVFDPVRDRIRCGKGLIRKMRADYLAYSLIDAIVDQYFIILEHLEDKIEKLEEGIVANHFPQAIQMIHHLKKEMIILRKSIWPLREVISTLGREGSSLISSSTQMYLRDVYDHTVQVIEVIETSRDILSDILEIYLSSVSNRLNSIMKVLTVIATIFMPLTFIASIYGMNFKHMPELNWTFGYPIVVGIMCALGIWMLLYFWKKKWL